MAMYVHVADPLPEDFKALTVSARSIEDCCGRITLNFLLDFDF